MITENDQIDLGSSAKSDPAEESREEGLRWLLDMELSEPEEKLFDLAQQTYQDEGLTDFEAEVASRPLVRGNAASDDLASYVAEEIVISSEGGDRSDIYATGEVSAVSVEPEEETASESMAIDYSRTASSREQQVAPEVDGSDILGLVEQDDIGEKFLTIKRVKRTEEPATAVDASTAEPNVDEEVDSSPAEPVMEADASVSQSTEDSDQWALDTAELLPIELPTSEPEFASPEEMAQAESLVDCPLGAAEGDGADDDSMQEGEALSLSEAPVTSQVTTPGEHVVANEDPVSAETGSEMLPSVSAHQDGSATDYVVDNKPPVDDEDFDQYLLNGENLAPAASDPEELVVEGSDGVVSVDPDQSVFIDYPEDFLAMDGVDSSAISSVAEVISAAVEEISKRAQAFLRERGQAAEALAVDVMLGTEPQSIKRCYAEGFEPVTAICAELPAALESLTRDEVETIYVRLFNGQTNENWNDLFTAEDSVSQAPESESWADSSELEALFDDLLEEETGVPVAPLFPADEVEGFGEELLGVDIDSELGISQPASEADIEDVFSYQGQVSQDIDEICGVDVDEFAVTAVNSEEVEESDVAPQVELAEQQCEEQPVEQLAAGNWCVPEGIAFSYTSQSSAEVFSDFLDAFIEEGSAEVEKLEDAFGEWEKNPSDESALAPIARTLHTIKGIAKGVGLQRYGTLVHNFETLLEAMSGPQDESDASYFRMINAWLDAVVRGLDHVQEQRSDVTSEFPQQASRATDEEVGGTEAVSVEDVEETPGSISEPVSDEPSPTVEAANSSDRQRARKRDQKLADEGAKALVAQQSVRITAEKLDHLLNLTSQAQQLGVRSAQSTNKGRRATAELQGRLASVRTQIGAIADRALVNVNARGGRTTPDLDALEMDQYSELQEAASILREGVEDLADLVEVASRQNALVDALLKQQASVVTSITSSIQAARVVPVSRLMPSLRRIVRTVSTDLDKSVSFKVLNEVGALDRDHYARCQTILEHMVRNALDHGIESAEERLAMGKPTAGRITIDVRKSGGDYLIRLADDGRGIDPDAIRESAFRKGLDIEVDKLSDDEALRLIFHKGFSTASKLSEISGRGVGMDIVMSELQQLGGDIQIKSTVGLGTSFDIRIPANVTVNGALFVTAGDSSYAIPLNGLIAVEQVPVTDFYRAVEHGTSLSLFDLECEPAYLATLCAGESLPDQSSWGITVPVIIAGSEDRYMAIAIDNVEEALELVVRSLGAQFSGVPGVAGAATTADGEAIVALDLNLLVESVDDDGLTQMAVSRPQENSLLALVVDDSRTQRMVATSQLDTVGVETITAENGMVAIDLLNGAHRLPDVVLLDVEMPVQDGIETLKEIRKSRRFGHLPVIMVTSRTGAKHRAMARQAGCNGYMGKPFNFPALVEQISELTGHELQLS